MKNITKLFSLLLFISCSSGHVVTTNIHNLAEYEENSNVYTLPQTRLLVTITALKTETVPGPYHLYAKKHLGIEGATVIPTFKYKIEDIEVNTQSIPDPDYCYSVRSEKYGSVEVLIKEMQDEGLIMSEGVNLPQTIALEELNTPDNIEYTDLSIKPFYYTDNKGGVSASQSTKDFVATPYLKKQFVAKTMEDKADEAAQFLFKLRKRRFKLLSGQYEVFPEGVALEASVKELDELEAEYLSLFIGKEKTKTITRTYSLIPGDTESLQRFTLLRFSDETGFHPTDGGIGEAIILELTDLESNKTLSQLQRSNVSSGNYDILYYRLTNMANVKIFYGSHEVLEAEVPVFQFGPLLPKYIPPVKNKLF